MKRHTRQNFRNRARGITLIEILLVIGLMVILVSFAVPSAGGVAARAELKAATENLQFSIHSARNSARLSESEVTMNISSPVDSKAHSIAFTVAGQKPMMDNHPFLQDHALSEEIAIVSDHSSFTFDGKGLVRDPGKIILIARSNESLTATIDIH